MAINIFDTRSMLAALDVAKPAQTFLRDRYFGNVQTFDTAKVDIDIRIGKRRMAPFVHPKIGGKTVDTNGYRTESYEPPEVSPDTVTTAEDMLKRGMGETIYGASDPNMRAARKLGEDLQELDDMIRRREEWMCSQILFTGKVDVVGDGYDDTIQFWPGTAEDPYIALGAGDRWNEATADIFGDLRTGRRTVMQGSGVTPVDCLMGQDAASAMLDNDKVLKKLDLRRIDMGIIDPQNLPNGVTYLGYLKDPGIDLWTYDEWYLDDDGDEQPMVPADSVLLGSPNVRTSMLYGAVTLMKGENEPPEFYAMPRVPDSWTQRKNPAGRIVQIKSKPLPCIHQIDGFRVLKVLA